MGDVAHTEVGEEALVTQKEVSPIPWPRIIPLEKYNEAGGIFNPDDYTCVGNSLSADTEKLNINKEDPHIKQALSYAVNSGLLQGTEDENLPLKIQDTLRIYALIREAGMKVLNRNRIAEQVKARQIPYQETAPLSKEEASLGEWALRNGDQVVFAEARRFIGGQEAYNQYTKQYPNIFPKESGLKPEEVKNPEGRVKPEKLKVA